MGTLPLLTLGASVSRSDAALVDCLTAELAGQSVRSKVMFGQRGECCPLKMDSNLRVRIGHALGRDKRGSTQVSSG